MGNSNMQQQAQDVYWIQPPQFVPLDQQMLQTKQNRAIKELHNKNFFTPITQLHKELKYPKVKDIEKNQCYKIRAQSEKQ